MIQTGLPDSRSQETAGMNPFSTKTQESIQYVAELIGQSNSTVALTGAGISTPSGIPDFRSEGTGLWSQYDPQEVASLSTFRYKPERFFEWMRPLARFILDALPNPAHLALARLEHMDYLQTTITQNIDGLHQKAGSKNVLETHGTFRTLSCSQCFQQFPGDGFIGPFVNDGIIPHCLNCGGILKPDAILFGEQLPAQTLYKAQAAARTCELMLVVGSSLEVLPVAGLPLQALDRGAHLVIVNHTSTYLAPRADVVILGDAAEIIPVIAERVLNE